MSEAYLRRYTNLPALIYMLSERCITLLDPASWDDQNDSHYLRLYREKKKLGTVLALCMSQTDETYHHWRVFASGSSGVCVKFLRAKLLASINRKRGVLAQEVRYLRLGQIRSRKLKADELPFLKRAAYIHEREFRILYRAESERLNSLDIPISRACIERITLSPWIHPKLSEHVKKSVRSIPGCASIKVYRSTLIGNAEWQELGDNAT